MIVPAATLREKVIEALDAARAVAVTLGPGGRTVAFARKSQPPAITKDGVTVAKSVRLSDPVTNAIWSTIRQAASVCADSSGDGTTAAIVIAKELLLGGIKEIAAGAGPTVVRDRISAGCREVLADLQRQAVPADSELLEKVAAIAANGDSQIAGWVVEALKIAGSDGVTVAEKGQATETRIEKRVGMQFGCGAIHEGFFGSSDRIIMDDPMIVMSADPLTRMEDLVKVAEAAFKLKLGLLVVAPNLDGPALAFLLANSKGSALKVCAVRAPGVGDHGRQMLEDLALATNGIVISKESGFRVSDASHKEMGIARQAIIGYRTTTIVEGGGNPLKIANRIHVLRDQVKKSTNDYTRQMFQERLSRLSGGMAIIKVGGQTETEIGERFHRTEDALFAARAAIEEGVVPGGGMALLLASINVKERLVAEAIKAPFRQIIRNAGRNPDTMEEYAVQCGGYDLSSRTMAPMSDFGVVDSAQAVRLSVQAACSVAATLIGTEIMVSRNGSRR